MVRPDVLVVATDTAEAASIETILAAEGLVVRRVTNRAAALDALKRAEPAVLITDDELPDGRGVDLVKTLRDTDRATSALVLVDGVDVDRVVENVRAGAHDVVEKPVFDGHLASVVSRAQQAWRERVGARDDASSSSDPLSRPSIVGTSTALERVLAAVAPVTRAGRPTVLVEGESGTGKELIARAIHYDGPRAAHPFLAVNCATLTENLLEAELFGYEKGAFTGAHEQGKAGLFEAADGGTLFLDEVGELAPPLQAKLLRVLQEGTFKRVGGVDDVRVDVRVIAATNRELKREVETGRFRADLYYRIAVFPVRMPPLRDRRSDIPDLCRHFLDRFAGELGKRLEGFSVPAMEQLSRHPWPGNIRELRNVCEYAAIVCEGEVIETRHLNLECAPADAVEPVVTPDAQPQVAADGSRDFSLRAMERELIRTVLEETRFNVSRAANLLGINRSTLYNKMKDYGLSRDDRRDLRRSV